MNWGNFVRNTAIAIGLAAVVVAAIYLATRFLLFLEAGVAPMNEPERRYVVAHEADRLTSAVLARFLLALA